MDHRPNHRRAWLVLLLGLGLTGAPGVAQEEGSSDRDRRFFEMISGKQLQGKFTISGPQGESPAQADLYMVSKLEKGEGDTWIFTATMGYAESAIHIPVPVEVLWAGDTPVITITDQTIEGLGTAFSARVLLDDGHYAGTWRHGPVGGHMWGRLVEAEESEADSP